LYIRKIAAAASLATGAALALAPFAHADIESTVLDSEVSVENHIFELEALLAGQSSDITVSTTPGVFDTIPASDIPTTAAGGAPTTFETELYGVNPIAAGFSSNTGPFNEFNGALTQFFNAGNAELYSLVNGGQLDTNPGDYIDNKFADTVLGAQGETAKEAFDAFYNRGIGDLSGYFQKDLSALLIPTTTSDAVPGASSGSGFFDSLLTGEVHGLNSLFDMDASLAGVSGDIVHGTGVLPFDTIPTGDATSAFDTLVFGFNPDSVTSGVPGSYDVLNGALGEFANAFNVETYSLLNGGDMLPVTDLIGLHTDYLTGTVATAVGDFLHTGVLDVAGYFDFSSLLGSL
jgi:hypothetical protein